MGKYYQGQKAENPQTGEVQVYDVKKGWMAMDQSSTAAYKKALTDVQTQKDSYSRMKDQSPLLQQADQMLGRENRSNTSDGRVDTGGLFNQSAIPFMKSMAPMISPDANSFDQTSKQIQSGISPPPGQGALSDYERNMFAAAAPSLSNFTSVNRQAIARRQAIINEQRDYANFLDDYVRKHGNDQGAQEIWQRYTTQDPYSGPSAKNPNATVAYSKDPDRWRRFIYGGSKVAQTPTKTKSGATVSNW